MKCKINKRDMLFLISLLGLFCLLTVRCFYGFGVSFADEFSQPAVVKRFFQGDRLLIDDWQPATTLIGYFLYACISFLPKFNFSLLELRIIYVIFQFAVALFFLFVSGWKDTGSRICVVAYLCSTPYGIMSICYNTVAIGLFILFLALFVSEYKALKVFFSGILLAIAVLANPYLSILFAVYMIITTISVLTRKKSGFFTAKRFKWLILGILVIFVPFCIVIAARGSVQEYVVNLSYIFGDKEHSEYGLLTKLVMSHYQIFRVYWRIWVPVLLTVLIAIFTREKKALHKWIYTFVSIFVVYGTIRFAFIYGSVSINLMIVPLFFWGFATIILMLIWNQDLKDYYYDIIWMICGYLFAICNFLATNTEILSMSAMFIVSALASIRIAIKFCGKRSNRLYGASGYITIVVFVISLLVLRMTYIWGDSINATFEARIDRGVAKGIYTSEQTIKEYDETLRIIDAADITSDDVVLFVPINALYYLETSGGISSPYVGRFDVDADELKDYYKLHPYKMPTKVLFINQDIGEYDVLVDYFKTEGYDYTIIDEKSVVLSRKN